MSYTTLDMDTCTVGMPLDAKHLTQLLRDLVAQFPQAVPDLSSDAQRPDPLVEKIVRDKIRQWDLGLPSHVYEKYFIFGHSIAITAYHHVPSLELQAEIGLFTGLAILVDDAVMGTPAVEEFVTRFCTGSPQLHPSLDRFAETVHGLGKYFTQYGANAILSSTIDYCNSELFQRGARDLNLGPNSIPYTKYMRGKDGYVEAYAAFVWPKDVFPDTKEYIQAFPDTMEYLSLINDVFSYYKEAKAGETGTYILNVAAANSKGEGETLKDLIEYILALVQRVRGILGEGKARDAWESFAAGYIRYHLQTERYKLAEIMPELLSRA